MSQNVVLNRGNITNKSNSRLEYHFPRPVKFGKDDTVAISDLSLYFSIFNISKKNNNNFFQYKWYNNTDGDVTEIIDVVIEDGYYSIDSLYKYLQKVMVENGHYLETTDGNNYIYFIELLENATYYSSSIRLSSAAQVMDLTGEGNQDIIAESIVNPPTSWKLPSTFKTPQLIIPSNNKFGELLGFSAQTIYKDTTGETTNKHYAFLNDIVPNMMPQSSFILTCNLCDNELSNPNNIISSFTVSGTSGIGDRISPISDVVHCKVKEGTYNSVIINIYDQNFEPIEILDPDILIVLSVLKK